MDVWYVRHQIKVAACFIINVYKWQDNQSVVTLVILKNSALVYKKENYLDPYQCSLKLQTKKDSEFERETFWKCESSTCRGNLRKSQPG